jgi:phage tail tube protein FII
MTTQINHKLINQGKFKCYAKNKLDKAIHNAYLKFKKNRDGFNTFQNIALMIRSKGRPHVTLQGRH